MVTLRGTPTVLMDGICIRQEVGISNQPGQSTLTVTGEDLSVLMSLEEKEDKQYPSLSPSAKAVLIIAQPVKDNRYVFYIDPESRAGSEPRLLGA